MDKEQIRSLINQSKGREKQIAEIYEENIAKNTECEIKLQLVEKAQVFLQKVAQDTQSQLQIQIEDIVNLALDTCFPNEYKFKVEFVICRGKTECNLKFEDKITGKEVDPMSSSGGGVIDLTCFALRIACYVLEQGTSNTIILDEPFKFLSKDLQGSAGEILRTLSDKLGLQIIMVTHIQEMMDVSDRTFEIKKINGESKINLLT